MIDAIIKWVSDLMSGHEMTVIASLTVLVTAAWCGMFANSMYRAWTSPQLTRFEKWLNVILDSAFILFFICGMFLLFAFVYHVMGNPSIPSPPHPPYAPDDWWRYGGPPCMK